jgi:hypothetical protein
MKKSIIPIAIVAFLWSSNTLNAQKKETSSV